MSIVLTEASSSSPQASIVQYVSYHPCWCVEIFASQTTIYCANFKVMCINYHQSELTLSMELVKVQRFPSTQTSDPDASVDAITDGIQCCKALMQMRQTILALQLQQQKVNLENKNN